VVIDRLWNVVLANAAAGALVAGLPAALAGPPLNVFRACLHPDGLARNTLNFPEWSLHLLEQLRRAAAVTADDGLQRLAEEVARYPNVVALHSKHRTVASEEPTLLVPLRLAIGGAELSLFTTLTTFGTAQDITLSELAVELFFPADAASDALLRASAAR
jgi:hypothetical protein